MSGTASRPGDVLLINEQMARKQRLELGDKVKLENGRALTVGGIYSDYGNPLPQVMVSIDLLLKWYPDVEKAPIRHTHRF